MSADAALAAAPSEGWLTEPQARRLWAAGARARPAGAVVEIGSFRGRSTVVLALATGSVVAIDPHAGSDRGPQEIAPEASRGNADHDAFAANLAAAGVSDRVRHVRKFSDAAHADVDGPLSLLYVDGAHRFGPARADVVDWGGRVEPGGTMLVHDAFSSIGVTLALARFVRRLPRVALHRADGKPGRVLAAGGARDGCRAVARSRPPSGRAAVVRAQRRDQGAGAGGAAALGGADRAGSVRALAVLSARPSARISSAIPATAAQWTTMRLIGYSGL